MADRPHLIPKYEAILASNGYIGQRQSISKIIVTSPNHLKGEYIGSVCTFVTLHLCSGEQLELFVKELPKNPQHANSLEFGCLFEKECGFYNEVLRDFRKLSVKPLNFFPRCYYADEQEIILENLVKSNKDYFLNSRIERQDLEYARFVLPYIAQFHALSYCILADIGEDAFLQKYPYVTGEGIFSNENHMLTGTVELICTVCEEILNNNRVPGGDRALTLVKKYKGKVFSTFRELIDPKTSSHLFKIMNHGDVWNNNMLFLRDSETKSLNHFVLVDFQTIRYCSPNLDLTYYFFTSLKQSERREHWKELLELYFKEFQSTVGLQQKPNNNNDNNDKSPFPFTFDDFIKDYCSKSFLGFWFNLMYYIGAELMSSFDVDKVEGDLAAYFTKRVYEWIAANKEKGTGLAKDIVQFCDEFEELTLIANGTSK